MPITPWGSSETLRERQLRPGPGVPRDEVERNQRERLYGAMVAVCAENGYLNTSVSDVIAVAGVSRGTFYKYFEDKEACFTAAIDEIIAAALTVVETAVAESSGAEIPPEGLSAFLQLMVWQPAAARVCFIEVYPAGPRAIAKADWAADRFVEISKRVLDEMPGKRGLPEEIVRAMIGGVRKVLQNRLHRAAEAELLELVEPFLELGLLYDAPTEELRSGWARARGRRHQVRAREGADIGEEIELATMRVVAARGFSGATIAEVASAAGVSLSTFYLHFDGKAEALDAGLYRARLRLAAAVLPAFRNARHWPLAVRAAVLAGLTFLEEEADVAQLLSIEVYGAGEPALEFRRAAIEAFEHLVAPGVEASGLENPVTAEGMEAGVYALISERVQAAGVRDLRDLAATITYVVLVPFLGAAEATTFANGATPERKS